MKRARSRFPRIALLRFTHSSAALFYRCAISSTSSIISGSRRCSKRVGLGRVVADGPLRGRTLHELWTQDREKIFGDVPNTPRFPLLIKILDAQEKLSLQVHPPENVASRLGGEPKSEFWYVAAADPNAELFLGFREPITRDVFEQSLRAGTVIDHVHRVAVQAGDALFIPAGRVHAIGAGSLLIEIQQNSDTTYRAFDWNRIDPATGTKRDLHLEQAIQCIDFDDVRPKPILSESECTFRILRTTSHRTTKQDG